MSVSPRKGPIRAVDASESSAQGEAVDARHESPQARQEEAPVAGGAAKAPVADKKKRSPILPIIGLVVVAAGGYYGYDYWTEGRFMISTDDAYIGGDIAVISPKVSGYVKTVQFNENQMVKAGDILVTLDDGDYRIALAQAESQLNTQKLTVMRIDAQEKGAEAALEQAVAQKMSADATLHSSELTFKRVSDLQSQSFMSTANLDTATSNLESARANVAAGSASIDSAKANIAVLKAQKAEAEAGIKTAQLAVDKAQRDLDFTVLRAPYDGVIGNRGVQVGDLVSSGKRLVSLVPVKNLYIDANFKETQIAGIAPGSKVKIHVDAYGDKPIEGTVDSIAPGSGAVFSMLPAENATGNFTKVIQRVPVRISIPQDVLNKGQLRAGLSVVVDVDSRTTPKKD